MTGSALNANTIRQARTRNSEVYLLAVEAITLILSRNESLYQTRGDSVITIATSLVTFSIAVILAVSRVLSIYIVVRDVPPKRRAKVLKGLAKCQRSWHRRWLWRE